MEDKAKTSAEKLTVQTRGESQPGLFWMMVSTNDLLAPWWSKGRDHNLRAAWRQSDFFQGAMYTIASRLTSVPFRVEPRDPSVKSHWRDAERFEIDLVEGSEFQSGWQVLINKWLLSRWTSDNGSFMEVIGAGSKSGPIRGPAVGLAHLDSAQCSRTGDAEFPVVYQDVGGKRYKLHRTRVILSSELPSTDMRMNGVGTCWLSRCFGMAQHTADMLRYVQEKLGSRPTRAVLLASGMSANIVSEAFAAAEESGDNQGLSKFSRFPLIADPSSTANLNMQLLDFASLPDGFDFQTDTTLAVYTMAMTGGFPPRWIWPATATGATKADAQYQHMVGNTSGAGATLSNLQHVIGGSPTGNKHMAGKYLPPHLKLTFDFKDDEQDRARAEIKASRSEVHSMDLANESVDIRTVREQMLSDGDLTEAQFEDLELQDGRLVTGEPLEALLHMKVDILENLDVEDLDAVKERLERAKLERVQSTSARSKREAKQALFLLMQILGGDEEEKPPEPEEDIEEEETAESVASEILSDRRAARKQPSTCVCPECGHEQDKVAGEPCRSLKCPECGAVMEAEIEKQRPETCVCPSCGHEQEKQPAEPCRSLDCPECGATMEAKIEKAARIETVRAKAARIIPPGADEPVVPVPDVVEITDADIEDALRWWDELMPEYAGMLDAEVEGRVDYD